MKNNIDDATEKSGVNKDKISGSDKQGDRNVEIIDVNMEVEQWYSIANLIYVLLVGYVWVRYMMGNPASGNVLRLIDSIFIWMALWIPHAVKVEPLKAKLPTWFVWLAAIAALFALAIVGVARWCLRLSEIREPLFWVDILSIDRYNINR